MRVHLKDRMKQQRTSRGITLMEMLVVLAIVSVALAVVAPSARAGIAGVKARSATRKVAALVASARTLAIRSRRPVTLDVDERSRSIRLRQAGNEPLRELLLDDDIAIAAADPESEQDASTTAGSTPVKSFIFWPDGEVPALKLDLTAANRTIRLRMDVLTGALLAVEAN